MMTHLTDLQSSEIRGGISGVGSNASRYSRNTNNAGGNPLGGDQTDAVFIGAASQWGAINPPGSVAFTDLAQTQV